MPVSAPMAYFHHPCNDQHYSSDGHSLYRWEWNEKAKELGVDSQIPFGVMAQEVKETDPMSVVETDEGYYAINYKGLS